MKDAKGHGSDPRGGAAHQLGVHGLGRVPAWGAAIKEQVRRFAKNNSGQGRPMLHHTPDDPELYNNAAEAGLGSLHQGHLEPSVLAHYAHFLHFLAGVALMDVLVRCFVS